MKKVVVLLFALMMMALASCAYAIEYTAENPLVLRFNTGVKGEGMTGSRAIMAFRDYIEKKSEGRMKVDIYWNQVLANSTESVVGGIQLDSFQGSEWPVASFGEYSAAFMPLDVPYLVKNSDQIKQILMGDIGREMAEKFKQDTGLRVVGYLDIGFRHVTSNKKPINTMADFAGMKLRLQSNPLHMMAFEAFGALPTQISFAELFTALQTNTVDAQENPLNLIYREKFYEVQDYLTLTYHLANVAAFVMSEEYIESLPKDFQKIIEDAFEVSLTASSSENEESQELWLSEMSQHLQIIEMSDESKAEFAAKTQELLPAMAQKAGEEYFLKVTSEIANLE